MSNGTVSLRGQTIKLFERDCLLPNEKTGRTKPTPFIDINVSMTNACNASCQFCCNQGRSDFQFDVEAFKDFFDEARAKISINKVTFTGGEPSLRLRELNGCLDHIGGKCSLVTVNTNGSRLSALDHPSIHRIALSRHHYCDSINDGIFGMKIGNPLIGSPLKDRIAIVCNLIKGKIDSTKEAYNMLGFASDNDIEEMSFVGLMPLNDFSVNNMVSLESLDFKENILLFRELEHEVPGVCKCRNYIYVHRNGNLVSFYMRHSMVPKFDKGSRVVWENNRIRRYE